MTSDAATVPAIAEPVAAKPSKDPDEIAEEIRQTNERLAGNLDELTGRLKPSRLFSDAKDGAVRLIYTPEDGVNVKRAAAVSAVVVVLVLYLLRRPRR